jgi:hypothetical protein
MRLQLSLEAAEVLEKETAILLSKMGLNVVIRSRTQKEMDSTIKEIKEIIKSTNGGAANKDREYLV